MKNIKRTIQLVKNNQPRLMAISLILTLVDAIFPLLEVFFSAQIVSSLIEYDLKKTIYMVIITLVTNCVFFLTKKKIVMLKRVQDRAFYFRQKQITANKIMEIDYETIESSKYHEMYRSLEDLHEMTGYRLSSFVDGFFQLVGDVVRTTIAFVSVIMLLTKANIQIQEEKNITKVQILCIGVMFLLLTMIIVDIIIAVKKSKNVFQYSQDMLSVDKCIWYYDNVYFNDYRNGKEIRIYNQKEFIGNQYEKVLEESAILSRKMGFKQGISALISSILTNINIINMYGFVVVMTLLSKFTVDDIVFNIGVFSQLLRGIESGINNLIKIKEIMIYINKYWEFMDYEMEMAQQEKSKKNLKDLVKNKGVEIEFLNVSYSYGNSFSLKNISFKIRSGEKVALVGLNGSGKTTLIMLLCRLYTPTSGEIKINGFNINEYDKEEYFKLLSVVFQDFKLFSFTLGQNIAAAERYEAEMVEEVLMKSGLKMRETEFINGLDTYLYNNFGESGIEISGGEEQKIAIARALYKKAPLLILDEPTAALDPISEDEIYTYINKNVDDKTVIYISHRLSACKFADAIIVLDNGELIQYGTHKELLKDKSTRYYEMWSAQAQYYTDVEKNNKAKVEFA